MAATNCGRVFSALVKSRSLLSGRFQTDPVGAPKVVDATRDTVYTPFVVDADPEVRGPVLWAYKRAPQYVTPGQKMVYEITYGNCGDKKIDRVSVFMNFPKGVTLDRVHTSEGFETDLFAGLD